MGFHPTSELVAEAWIGSLPGFTASMVATQPPPPDKWPVINGVSQFITVAVVGGSPPRGEAPIAAPVLEIKGYATQLRSNKPQWAAANQLLELIRLGCYQRTNGVFGRALVIESGNVTYNPANVTGTIVHTEPRRVYSDPRNFGVYLMEMTMVWKEVNLSIA
jgi:hypothetical protein